MFLSCKDDDGIDASNIKNSCYEEYVYRNYPDLQTDTVTYYFKDDTITAIGYIYKSVDNRNIPNKKRYSELLLSSQRIFTVCKKHGLFKRIRVS